SIIIIVIVASSTSSLRKRAVEPFYEGRRHTHVTGDRPSITFGSRHRRGGSLGATGVALGTPGQAAHEPEQGDHMRKRCTREVVIEQTGGQRGDERRLQTGQGY